MFLQNIIIQLYIQAIKYFLAGVMNTIYMSIAVCRLVGRVLGIAEAKSKKCKAFLFWHIKWVVIILWASLSIELCLSFLPTGVFRLVDKKFTGMREMNLEL